MRRAPTRLPLARAGRRVVLERLTIGASIVRFNYSSPEALFDGFGTHSRRPVERYTVDVPTKELYRKSLGSLTSRAEFLGRD